jgi:hypothetical protein
VEIELVIGDMIDPAAESAASNASVKRNRLARDI